MLQGNIRREKPAAAKRPFLFWKSVFIPFHPREVSFLFHNTKSNAHTTSNTIIILI